MGEIARGDFLLDGFKLIYSSIWRRWAGSGGWFIPGPAFFFVNQLFESQAQFVFFSINFIFVNAHYSRHSSREATCNLANWWPCTLPPLRVSSGYSSGCICLVMVSELVLLLLTLAT